MSGYPFAPDSDAYWTAWAMARYQARRAAMDHPPSPLEDLALIYAIGSEEIAAIQAWRTEHSWRTRLRRWLGR